MQRNILLLILSIGLMIPILSQDPGEQDAVNNVPGYGDGAPKVYAGQLKTKNGGSVHYVLVAYQQGLDKQFPVTVWLSSAPGCSPKIALLSEIGPFLLPPGTSYNTSVQLTPNPNSWNKFSNLLFIDSPQGTGHGITPNSSYLYNDQNTADDTLSALISFFNDKFLSLRNRNIYLAGSSYAGKFIPDLALRITNYNLGA